VKPETDIQDDTPAGVPEASPVLQVSRLVGDFRSVAFAEFDYYRDRISYSAGVAKSTGILVALTLFCLFATVVALILGVLLAVGHALGFVLGTLIIVGVFAASTLLLAWLARKSGRRLAFPELTDGAEND
jgi:uncharacterized membrane protein YdjX (TVP38/TMEM64 family)